MREGDGEMWKRREWIMMDWGGEEGERGRWRDVEEERMDNGLGGGERVREGDGEMWKRREWIMMDWGGGRG